MASIPSAATRGHSLYQIEGSTPSVLNLGPGCAFRSRCHFATAQCETDPVLVELSATHSHHCWHGQEQNHG